MPNTLHICLVSSQLQPNVIPWRELKPQETLLIASDKVDAEAQQLLKIARDLGLKANRYPLAIPTDSFANVREFFLDLAMDLPGDMNICVNLTGGTKLMTLAAADVLAGEVGQFFYTDTNNRRIEFINLNNATKSAATTAPQEFSDPLELKQLIACGMAGIRDTGTQNPKHRQGILERESFTQSFTRAAVNHSACINSLNWRISKQILTDNGQALKQDRLQLDQKEENAFRKILAEAHDSRILQYDTDTATLHFRNVAEARWLHGIWLEEFVWLQMRAAGLKQYDTGVQLEWYMEEHKDKHLLSNEIDAIGAHDNRLCIIECKTGKLKDEGKQDIIHKLSRLSFQMAGPFGKPMLVSLHAPNNSIADRAKHSNVTIVCGQQLLNLKQTFLDWISRK